MTKLHCSHRSRGVLADGRELFYYDSEPDRGRERYIDARELEARPAAPELRYDALRDEWVSVASARMSRPTLADSGCPLCPSASGAMTEIPAPDYEVAVFENRFPSFHGPVNVLEDGAMAKRAAGGRCEVVCFASEHDASFRDLDESRVTLVMDALADRTAQLSHLDEVAQVFCFENRGEDIGVTLHHPHGQIYGYPYVTPTSTRMLDSARKYRDRHGGNLFADLVARECEAEARIVAQNSDWVAFVPYSARWPFEVSIYPTVQVPDLAELPRRHRLSFGEIYLPVLRALDSVFDVSMPYISGWHQAPTRVDRDLAHLHLQLLSTRRAATKLKYPAGSESAMGAFVNDMSPEESAARLRDALPPAVSMSR